MVLDGEQHETLGILLQEGLVGLLGLDGGSHGGLRLLLLGRLHGRLVDVLGVNLCLEGGEVGVEGRVLLVGSRKIELLDGRLHLEGLDGGRSLQRGGS